MTALTRAAQAYAAQGWPVFPLQVCGKRPLEDGGFHTATTDPAAIAAWWSRWPNANIGLHPAGAGLLVIDVDGPVGEQTAERLGLLAEPTLEVVTGRQEGGRHRYYRHPGGTIGNVSLGMKLDVRADNGYVILPPSVHPTGAAYRWLGRAPEISEIPPAIVERLRRPAMAPTAPAPPPVELPRGEALARRITAYTASVGTRAEGAGRNNAAFQIAAWLTRDMALDSGAAWPWLVSWNAGNTPPLGEGELRSALASALKCGRRSVGSGVERPRAICQPAGLSDLDHALLRAARVQRRVTAKRRNW